MGLTLGHVIFPHSYAFIDFRRSSESRIPLPVFFYSLSLAFVTSCLVIGVKLYSKSVLRSNHFQDWTLSDQKENSIMSSIRKFVFLSF